MNKRMDVKNLQIAISIKPLAKYPDGTWGAEVSQIIINGLPWNTQDVFPPINKKFVLLIEGVKASLIPMKDNGSY